MSECIFCKIVRGEIPSVKIYENNRVFAFEDINPIAPGHTLVIPKTHAENIWEMPEEDLTAIHAASKKIAQAMRSALDPTGVAALQLNGKGVNQLVMHYHLHLIPRLSEGPEITLTKWDLVPGDMAKIRAIGEKIAAAVQ